MSNVETEVVIKVALVIFGIVGTVAATLFGILINRLYKAIDQLFLKIGEQEEIIGILKLALLQSDPESTVLFRALTARSKAKPK